MRFRAHWLLLIVLGVGAGLRIAEANEPTLELIERDEFIPAALTITWQHHPIRVMQHAALPAYAIRLSGFIFGRTLPGWRALSVVAGVATIWLIYLTAAMWWGPLAAAANSGSPSYLFVVVVSPDLYSNVTITPEERADLWRRHYEAASATHAGVNLESYATTGLYMSYGDQLSRFRGLGLNKEPFYFYFGDLADAAGVAHVNDFAEFPYMHLAMALVLWLAVILTLVRSPKDPLVIALLTVFAVCLLPFAGVRLGLPRAGFPSGHDVLWYWVDRTMFPAMLLAGLVVSQWRARARMMSVTSV